MNRLILKAVSVAAILLSSAAAKAEWHEATSDHFIVVGDVPPEDLRKRTVELEQYDSMLRYLLGTEKAEPVTVFVLADQGAVVSAAGGGNSNIAGFYSPSYQRPVAVTPQRLDFYQEGFSAKVILLHEYAHHMLLSGTRVFMPGWAQEGLAEMFATAVLHEDGSVTIGDKNDARGPMMLHPSRWSVERMLSSDLDPPKDKYEAIEKYSRGWTLVHYLWMSGERPGQYVEFIKELNKTLDPVASGKKVFGDLKKLDRELDRYIRFHRYNLSKFGPDKLGKPSEVKVRTMSPGENEIQRFRIASAIGVTDKTAPPLAARARPIGEKYPDDPAVQVAIAEMEYDAKNDGLAEAAADRTLAVDPDNLYAMVYKGRVAIRRAIELKDKPEEAKSWAAEGRKWFLRANRVNPEHALPFVTYYDSFAAVGEPAPDDAVAGLFKATILVPQVPDLRIRSAIELVRHDEIDRAITMLAPTAFYGGDGKDGENDALKLIREMQASKDKEKVLAKATELKLDRVNEFIPPVKDEDKEKKAA